MTVPPIPPLGQPGASSAWWSDALSDPWRDPAAHATVVVPARGAAGPPPDGDVPDLVPRRGLGLVFLVSVVTALLAGALGGTLGYVFAVRGGGAPTSLGSNGNGNVPALAQRPPDTLAGVVQKVLPSVVTIRVTSGRGFGVGSGFVASTDGYVITNDHVVEGATGTANVLFSDGATATATIVGRDPESDIAVLKVQRDGLVPVEFGDSDAIAVGDPVLALGSPLALANTVTYGIVSAVDRPIQAGEPGEQVRYYAAIQTDAAVNQGNSGGPLVDSGGRVIGVNSVIKSLAVDQDEAGNIGLAFAVPINQAKRVSQEIIDTGKARRTVIGGQLDDNYRNPNGGVRLRAVDESGPAATAGLRAGDVVMKLDGHPVYEPTDLIALIRKHAPGSVVTVEYKRGSENQSASVTLAADVQ
ncbi:MAG TPA: trypsin-like peptidase domain-containing protein [Micromonosporaceae bacterium]|nr:trypsin-like peptidase domain-containing protein [Micromonosporaceae bacterium]